MPRVSVPEGADQEPVVPSGNYSEGVRVVSCSVRQVPGDNPDKEEFLDIGVGIPGKNGMAFAHTTPFGRYNTRLSQGSGSRAKMMVTQLGFNYADFDTDEVVGTPCAVEVEMRKYTPKGAKDGETRTVLDITNIARTT
jgi:hypothetical protein